MHWPKFSIALVVFSLIGVVVILLAGLYVLHPTYFRFGIPTSKKMLYPVPNSTYSKYGISFSYPVTYTVTERDLVINGSSVHLVALEEKDDSGSASDSAPSITVSIFSNTSHQSLQDWFAGIHNGKVTAVSGYESQRGKVGGESAMFYSAPGLSESDNAAVVSGSHAYLISAGWNDRSDPILKDFAALLSSVTFTK